MAHPAFVVGAGMAGTSASLHIWERNPGKQQSLICHHVNMETSDDYSKIVRADYENLERMKEAQEAQRAWKIGSWAQHYIENGRVVAHIKDSEAITSIDRNRVRLGLDLRQRGNKELLETYYGPTSFRDTLIFVFNPGDAVVDWQPCIRQHREAVKKVCLQTGGQIYKGALHALEHDGREVTAVVLVDGARIETKGVDVVLAVGAWTAEILGRFHMQLPPQGRNPTPTGLFAFRLELNDDQVEFFKDKPVFSHIGRAEFLPPIRGSRNAKITWVEPFTISPIRDVYGSAVATQTLNNAVE